MALHLNFSSSLKSLARAFLHQVKSENKSVFAPNYIITQTEGMNNWLKIQMADELGIAANYEFLKPNDFIFQIYYLLAGKPSQTLHPENQKWLLFKLLNENEFKNKFTYVADYYATKFENAAIKRFSIAQSVADLFDQYQIYRKELVDSWNISTLEDVQEDEWQKYLWIKAQNDSSTKLPDKTLVAAFIEHSIKDLKHQQKVASNFTHVHLFGLSVITSYHLKLFHLLSQHIEIHFHLLNPAPEQFWFEDKNEKYLAHLSKKKGLVDFHQDGNTLLLNWGKITQDTFSMIFQNDYLLDHYNPIPAKENPTNTLLKTIQSDIYHNRKTVERENIQPAILNDGSIFISSCHTPLREVEVLYNYLVTLVNNKPNYYSARDIVVMASDINIYSPYIKAVFSQGSFKFPFTIADESYENEETLIQPLKTILELNKDNFTAEAVLQILEFSSIREKFKVNQIELIRNVVLKANIRIGINGSLNDDSIYISWKYGINRIILGLCMGGNDVYLYDETLIFPLTEYEGNETFHLIRFCHFVQVLISHIEDREKVQTPSDWAHYVEKTIQNFFNVDDNETDSAYNVVQKQLEEYTLLQEIFEEKISYEVFLFSYLQTLRNTTKANKFVTGGITFCSLIPMRSIPFKVVALLGLDADKFPRKEIKSEFNLMHTYHRGDRDVKNNDKHLFLETILAAEENLYISYNGQSALDNSTKLPSILVEELIDYISLKTADEKRTLNRKLAQQILVEKQPLHSFSKKYQGNELKIPNFLNINQSKFKFKEDNQISVEQAFPTVISTDSLIKFFQNPIQYYYNQILHIRYETKSFLIPENELFELDNLQKWTLRNDLFQINEIELPDYIKHETAKGNLPLKNMANIALNPLFNEINNVKDLAGDLLLATKNVVYIYELISDLSIQLNGEIADFYGDNLIQICFSKNEIKYILKLYIQYIIVTSAGIKTQAFFISTIKGKIFKGIELDQKEAINQLKLFIKWFKIGNLTLLPSLIAFKLNADKLAFINQDEFIALIHKDIKDEKVYDDYILNEYKNGFFELNSTFEDFKNMASDLLIPVYKFLPDFKF